MSAPARTEPANLRLLRRFWADILRLPLDRVSASTDLFALGADSMDLVYLETRIEAQFRVTLPDHAAIEAPTPEEMLDLIQECLQRDGASEVAQPRHLTVRFTTGEPGAPPLFVAPGAVGAYPVNVAWLARHLHGPQGVTGLVTTPPPASAMGDPQGWFDHICETWLAGIREAAPRGPWRIMAICMGAPYAWEISRILAREGETSLLFLDPYFGDPDLALPDEDLAEPSTMTTRRVIMSRWEPQPADLDLTLLLTPKWGHRPLAERYAALAPRTSVVRLLPAFLAGHGINQKSVAPVAAEVQAWLSRWEPAAARVP